MATKSIFSRGGNGMTTGGLNGYLGPEGQDFSNLPEHIEDPAHADSAATMECKGGGKDQAVCQIAKAEKEHEADAKG